MGRWITISEVSMIPNIMSKVYLTSQNQNETKFTKIDPVVNEIFQISHRTNKKITLYIYNTPTLTKIRVHKFIKNEISRNEKLSWNFSFARWILFLQNMNNNTARTGEYIYILMYIYIWIYINIYSYTSQKYNAIFRPNPGKKCTTGTK